MNRMCLCNECYEMLIACLKENNSDVEFNDREPYISGHTPCIELTYNHENGNEYSREICAAANYCCECGEEL